VFREKLCAIVSSGLLLLCFLKIANDDEYRDMYLSKKRKAVWTILRAIIALNWNKNKPTLLRLNFDYNKEKNFYGFPTARCNLPI
jgi:hypothetical protein